MSIELLAAADVGAAVVAYTYVAWAGAGGGHVDRARVERFAGRQRLRVTAGNGNQVIRYLATIRRWRVAGLTVGLVLSVAEGLPHSRIQVNYLPLFVGWFAGALIAEVRVAHLSYGERRAASLVPRRATRYVPAPALILVPLCAALSLGVAVVAAVLAAGGATVPRAGAIGWAVAAMVSAALVWLTQRRVLRRPQPVAAPDQVAADDAIRSRSLHVLCGAGAALGLYCVLGQVAALVPALPESTAQLLPAVSLLGFGVASVLGWTVATWPTRDGPRNPA